MSTIDVPESFTKRHGGADFYVLGSKFAETMALWAELTEDDILLDIGCGPGRMAIGIGEHFGWRNPYVGFDIIQQDIAFAEDAISRPHPNCVFKHLDLYNGMYNPQGREDPAAAVFPVEPGTVDLALATSVFTHMFKVETAHYIEQSARALKPGGRLFSTWFAIDPEARAMCHSELARFGFSHRRLDGTFIERPQCPEDVVAYDYNTIAGLFEAAGFTDITFHRGGWARIPGAKPSVRHSQDAFLCRKPR